MMFENYEKSTALLSFDEAVELHNELCEYYTSHEATSHYIFGLPVGKGKESHIFACFVDMTMDFLKSITTLKDSSSSRNMGIQLQLIKNAENFAHIREHAGLSLDLGLRSEFEASAKKAGMNNGYYLEQVIAEMLKGHLTDSKNERFDRKGDIEIDEISYQIKYCNACFTATKTMRIAQAEEAEMREAGLI